ELRPARFALHALGACLPLLSRSRTQGYDPAGPAEQEQSPLPSASRAVCDVSMSETLPDLAAARGPHADLLRVRTPGADAVDAVDDHARLSALVGMIEGVHAVHVGGQVVVGRALGQRLQVGDHSFPSSTVEREAARSRMRATNVSAAAMKSGTCLSMIRCLSAAHDAQRTGCRTSSRGTPQGNGVGLRHWRHGAFLE